MRKHEKCEQIKNSLSKKTEHKVTTGQTWIQLAFTFSINGKSYPKI